MPKRVYRTARGATVDMSTMLTKNETVPAIGNMRVNARGDEITSDGTITKTRNQIMQEYHNLSTMIPQDGAIPEGGSANQIQEDDWQDWEPAVKVQEPVKTVAETVEETSQEETKTPTGGLAAAVAAAKKVEQTVQPAKGTEEQETEGVRRI